MASTGSVQSVSQSGLSQVPAQYIQPPQTRIDTITSAAAANVPSIDLYGFDSSRRDLIREEVARACRDWGAFHIKGHGVPSSMLDRVRYLGLSFFNDFSMEEKLNYACDTSSSATEGYGSRMLENKDAVLDWRDYFDHHTLPVSRRNPSRWPHYPPDYRQVIADYSDQMGLLASKILALISESLGLPTSSVEDAVGEFYQNITMSYYPPCPQPDLTLGLQSHSDMGAVTLLIQDDVGGLQVLKDGEWVAVQPVSDAIVVILSDQTEVITNGAYKSAVHRAITNPSRARLSVATFHDPCKSATISPCAPLGHPHYQDVVYGSYVSAWYSQGPEGKRNIEKLLL